MVIEESQKKYMRSGTAELRIYSGLTAVKILFKRQEALYEKL